MPLDLDMIVETGAPDAPFGKDIALRWQRTQCTRRSNRRLFSSVSMSPLGALTSANAMAQPAQKPALDNAHRRLDLRLVARPPWSGRQHRTVVVISHPGIAAVDLEIVEAGLDHGDLGIVGNEQRRCAAEHVERVERQLNHAAAHDRGMTCRARKRSGFDGFAGGLAARYLGVATLGWQRSARGRPSPAGSGRNSMT